MTPKSGPPDRDPASDADLVRREEKKRGHAGGTPPADPLSQAARNLSRPRRPSRGEAEAERIERERAARDDTPD